MNSICNVLLSKAQMQILEELASASLTPQVVAIRAKILLLLDQGVPTSIICSELGISYTPVYRWQKRWLQVKISLNQIEKEKKKHELKDAIINTLKDAPRSGAPSKFTEEQVMQIIALACTSPEDESLPVSQWSCRLLAEHAKQLGIVENISFKQINNFLKSGYVKTS
jgi:putative transposase